MLPTPGSPLKATFSGPWRVAKKVSDLNYLIEMPNRRKRYQKCHINMLKPYIHRSSQEVIKPELLISDTKPEDKAEVEDNEFPNSNSEILKNLSEYLKHLNEKEKHQLIDIILEHKEVFKDDPGLTNLVKHDVDVGDARPIKQGPYRLNPIKNQIVDKEVEYMLQNNLIEASSSPWSSPVVLVKKERGKHGQH